MKRSFEFWDALAPHHSKIENSYLDVSAARHVLNRIDAPVLVVGAGQGLIVAELQKRGFRCDGVDLSREMIRYARTRRRLDLIEANASAMPFEKSSYKTIIYATGVIDFITDEQEIRAIINEGRRVVDASGKIFVAFYRMSAAIEALLVRLGLLKNNVLPFKEMLEIYRLRPVEAVAWIARRLNVGHARAAMLALRSWVGYTWQEKRNSFHMQRIFANPAHADALLQAAPAEQAYRNEPEIRNLFTRLAIPIKQFEGVGNCYLVQI